MDQMLNKIDRAFCNEVVKQERVAMNVYEINLKGDLHVKQMNLSDDSFPKGDE